MVKYFTGRAYDARFDLYLRLGGRQVSPGGEVLLSKPNTRPLNGAGSETKLKGMICMTEILYVI